MRVQASQVTTSSPVSAPNKSKRHFRDPQPIFLLDFCLEHIILLFEDKVIGHNSSLPGEPICRKPLNGAILVKSLPNESSSTSSITSSSLAIDRRQSRSWQRASASAG